MKYSVESNLSKRIDRDISEEERAKILKSKKIQNVAFVRALSVEDAKRFQKSLSWDDIDRVSGNEKRKLIQKIAKEFGVFKEYVNNDVSLSFGFSNNNYRESFGKQKKNFKSFAKMFSVFEQIIESAVGVEVHNRNAEGYKPDPTLKNAYVLISAFGDGDSIIPVKLEVKEFFDKGNTLYVAVSLEAIKMTEVSKQGTTENGVAQNSRSVNISISDLLPKINPKEVDFLKYIPDELLTDEQIASKNEYFNKSSMQNLDNDAPKPKLSVKASAETLSELKEKREGLVAEYRELRTQIDAIKESDEYKAFDNEVRTVRKNGSKFGGFEAVKEIRNRQKQWAEAAGLSALEERYDDISGQIHDYDLEIYKADKELKAKATAQLTEKVSKFSRDEIMDYAKKAAAKFGITKKFDNAGYMLPDGGLLDFSDGQGYRVLDHREIRDVLDFIPEDGNRSDGLIQLMNMGNIRMQIGGIDISRAPTKEQIADGLLLSVQSDFNCDKLW